MKTYREYKPKILDALGVEYASNKAYKAFVENIVKVPAEPQMGHQEARASHHAAIVRIID